MAERELIEQLKALDAGATKGPWEVDTEYCPDECCKNYFIGAPVSNGTEHGRWATLFDSVNSNHKLIETEYDEDGATSWDETARRNAALIVYLRNSVPAIIAMSEELEAVKAKAERLAEAVGAKPWPPSEADLREMLAAVIEAWWSPSSANLLRQGKTTREDIKGMYAIRDALAPYVSRAALEEPKQ